MSLRRILLPLSIFTTVLALIHWFIFVVTVRDIPLAFQLPLALFMAFALISMPLGLIFSHGAWRKALKPVTLFGYFWIGFFFLVFSFAVPQFLISIFMDHSYSFWPWIAGMLACAWSIFRALSPPRIITYTLGGPAVMEGLSLVQISDLHVGMPFLDEEWLARQVERINELAPDFVAITGDLADGQFDEVAKMLEPLAGLSPRLRKFYITGNHEFIRGGDWENRLSELGFAVLHNSHEIFKFTNGQLLIGGVPDRVILSRGRHFESSPDKALATKALVDYRILLAHEPLSVFSLRNQKCDLMLAGHTHGGQVFPFGLLVRLVQPLARGFKEINGVLVFAHMGTGFWGPPMRWLTCSEIVRFRWTAAAAFNTIETS